MTKATQKNRPSHGFTLVEMTAVAALMALLASATFVGYAQSWRHWTVRQNARQFFLAARYARLLAIESGQTCRLVIDRENGAFYVVQDADETGEPAMVSNVWHRPVTLADGVSFEQVTMTGEGAIAFRPDGSADAAMVQVGNGARQYTIQISSATARATLLDGASEPYEPDQIDLDQVY